MGIDIHMHVLQFVPHHITGVVNVNIKNLSIRNDLGLGETSVERSELVKKTGIMEPGGCDRLKGV